MYSFCRNICERQNKDIQFHKYMFPSKVVVCYTYFIVFAGIGGLTLCAFLGVLHYGILNGQCLHCSKRNTALQFILFITICLTVFMSHFHMFFSFALSGMFISHFCVLRILHCCRFSYLVPKYTISSSSFLP